MLPVKVIWDYTYYWGVLAQFFFQRRLTDLARCSAAARRARALPGAQRRGAVAPARVVGSAAAERGNPAVMLDQASLPWFAELNRSLLDRLDDAAFRERIRHSTRQMRSLAGEIARRAGVSGADDASLRRVLSEGARFGALEGGAAPTLFASA